MGLITRGKCSNFAPGVTHVPCCLCGDLVDVTGEGWNEDLHNPAHRLCWNSRRPSYAESLMFDAPMNVEQMGEIVTAVRKGLQFTDEQRRHITACACETAEWRDFSTAFGEETSPTRARVYAIRLLAFLATGLVYQQGAGFIVRSGFARLGNRGVAEGTNYRNRHAHEGGAERRQGEPAG